MPNITTELLARPNFDAVEWRAARDGDFILHRDPARREFKPAYLIDGAPRYERDSSIDCYVINLTEATRRPRRMIFSWEHYQVWRDFATTPRPPRERLELLRGRSTALTDPMVLWPEDWDDERKLEWLAMMTERHTSGVIR
ncbi:MAG TPA: hypothetical protein VFX15_03630 [Actinomycetes bacterium]|nr:hypothetical protein [Actinomycetes bacterium]